MRTTKLLIALLILAGSVVVPARAEDKPAEKTEAKPIRVLLICGGCCHDYAKQKDIISKGLADRANVEVTIAYDPDKGTKHLNPIYEKEDWYKGYDVILHDECSADGASIPDPSDTTGKKTVFVPETVERVLKPHKAGLPAVVLHCAMHCYRPNGHPASATAWMEFTGLNTNHHGKQLPIEVTYTDKESPITKGFADWTTINEELYHQEELLPTAKALATGKQSESDTVVWTNDYHGTRVFGTTLGHNNETVADPRYLDLVTRGLLWSTGHLTDDGKPAPGYEAKK